MLQRVLIQKSILQIIFILGHFIIDKYQVVFMKKDTIQIKKSQFISIQKNKKKYKFLQQPITVQNYSLLQKLTYQEILNIDNQDDRRRTLLSIFSFIEKSKLPTSQSSLKICLLINLILKTYENIKQKPNNQILQIFINQLNNISEDINQSPSKIMSLTANTTKISEMTKISTKSTRTQIATNKSKNNMNSIFNKIRSITLAGTSKYQQKNKQLYQSQHIKDIMKCYISHLLKKIGKIDQFQCSMMVKPQGMWQQINQLKRALKITKHFPHLLRYFEAEFKQWMICIVLGINSDVSLLYKQVSQYVMEKQSLIAQKIQEYNSWINIPDSIQQSLQNLANFQELRQVLVEVAAINQSMKIVYENKKLYFDLKKLQIHRQPYVDISNYYFDIVFNNPEANNDKQKIKGQIYVDNSAQLLSLIKKNSIQHT